ncbi:uncharacterized protein [Henckelia pumila]|uniref:uncharacterized protein n=1 Tax=Henckelia pumila TaxID=405737 RepID=UPI003C6E71AA
MASSARTAFYTIEEDKHLCHIYLDISQNPIVGINQSKDQFWARVEEGYNSSKPNTVQIRNKRSLQCRVKTILRQVGRLRGCIRQIEILKPSGASDEDILHRAKDLFMQDPNYSKGFKFDHSETHTPETPLSVSEGLNSFTINLSSDENVGDTSSDRPIEVKKAKLKKKKEENIAELLSTMKQGHHNLVEKIKKSKIEARKKQVALAALQEENRDLYMDLRTIGDPESREIVRVE